MTGRWQTVPARGTGVSVDNGTRADPLNILFYAYHHIAKGVAEPLLFVSLWSPVSG